MLRYLRLMLLSLMLTLTPTLALAQPSPTPSTSSSDTTVTLTGDELAEVVDRACAAARKKATLVPTLQAERDEVRTQRDIEAGRVMELRARVAAYDEMVRQAIESRWPRWVTWVAVPVGIALGVGVGVVVSGS